MRPMNRPCSAAVGIGNAEVNPLDPVTLGGFGFKIFIPPPTLSAPSRFVNGFGMDFRSAYLRDKLIRNWKFYFEEVFNFFFMHMMIFNLVTF